MHSRCPTIGVIGAGTVGKALIKAFEECCSVLVNDPAWGTQSTPLQQLINYCEAIFVAVPTPADQHGDVDLRAFTSVMTQLNDMSGLSASQSEAPVICIRSAVPPDAIEDLLMKAPRLRLVVSPEFLREASPVDDMLTMRSLVLGGDQSACEAIASLFHKHSNITGPMRTSILPDVIGAAFLKYQENAFLAMKVSFMNEFFDVFNRSGSTTSWEQLQTAFHQDHERMGTTHWSVPGPDGLRGWGGRCLPKDVSAFRRYATKKGADTPLLAAMWKRNVADRHGETGNSQPRTPFAGLTAEDV